MHRKEQQVQELAKMSKASRKTALCKLRNIGNHMLYNISVLAEGAAIWWWHIAQMQRLMLSRTYHVKAVMLTCIKSTCTGTSVQLDANPQAELLQLPVCCYQQPDRQVVC